MERKDRKEERHMEGKELGGKVRVKKSEGKEKRKLKKRLFMSFQSEKERQDGTTKRKFRRK